MSPKPFRDTINYFSPAVLLKASWERTNTIQKYPLAYHNDYELHFIKEGQGTYIIEGQACPFKAGHLVVIKPNQIHSLISKPGRILEKARLTFRSGWQDNVLRELKFGRGLPNLICLTDAQALCMEMIIKRILEENSQRAGGWENMIVALFHEFLVWVQRVRGQRVKPVKEKPALACLRRYIASHFADPQCQVASIARHFGYSLNYITALAREMCGMGLKRYLLQYRIIAARRILESNPELKIEAVAREVGFNQYRNFTRAFLEQTGMTASRYRYRVFYHAHCGK